MDLFLRLITVLLFAIWKAYWMITEKKADQEKPRTRQRPSFFSKIRMARHGSWSIGFLLIIQLLFNVPIFPINTNFPVQVIGFIFVIIGLGLCIVARKELGTNWANAYEYQIKQKQTLVATGVYSYIRNPIYTGLVTAVIGGELVAKSYIFLAIFLFFLGAYRQSKLEEKILEKHFGKEYLDYKKRTKMLIPFIF